MLPDIYFHCLSIEVFVFKHGNDTKLYIHNVIKCMLMSNDQYVLWNTIIIKHHNLDVFIFPTIYDTFL